MICHGCGKSVPITDKVFRGDLCPGCGRPLHACLNCVFHDLGAHNECREPQAEWVPDRAKANFCDYFRPRDSAGPGRGEGRSEQARKKLDDLFKK